MQLCYEHFKICDITMFHSSHLYESTFQRVHSENKNKINGTQCLEKNLEDSIPKIWLSQEMNDVGSFCLYMWARLCRASWRDWRRDTPVKTMCQSAWPMCGWAVSITSPIVTAKPDHLKKKWLMLLANTQIMRLLYTKW